jgi:hypothetical protein
LLLVGDGEGEGEDDDDDDGDGCVYHRMEWDERPCHARSLEVIDCGNARVSVGKIGSERNIYVYRNEEREKKKRQQKTSVLSLLSWSWIKTGDTMWCLKWC